MKTQTAKDLKIKDNYLCVTTGELLGDVVWFNIAVAHNGKVQMYQRSKNVIIPKKLEHKFIKLFDKLEKITMKL